MIRNSFTTVILTFIVGFSFGQSSFREYANSCTGIVELDSSEFTKQVLFDLGQLNKISLGDAGESSNPDSYIKRFENFVDFFDTTYTDSIKIEIIEKNYCPLISTYSFVSLVKLNNQITDSTIVELIMPFVKDTNSYINLDWGCGSHSIQTFDYLISLMSGKGWRGYFTQIEPLPYGILNFILNERKRFYSGVDQYNRKKTWEDYRNYYLK
jgi:hypothetical protein